MPNSRCSLRPRFLNFVTGLASSITEQLSRRIGRATRVSNVTELSNRVSSVTELSNGISNVIRYDNPPPAYPTLPPAYSDIDEYYKAYSYPPPPYSA